MFSPKGNGVALCFRGFNRDGQLAANYIVGNLDVICRIVRIIFFQVFNRQLECGRRSVCSLFGLKCKRVQLACRPGRRFARFCVQINRPNPAFFIRYIFICSIIKGIRDLFSHIRMRPYRNRFLKPAPSTTVSLSRLKVSVTVSPGGNRGLICAHSDGRFVCCKDGRYQAQYHCQCQQHRNQFFHVDLFPPLFSSTFQPGIP